MALWTCEHCEFAIPDGQGEDCPAHGTPLVQIDRPEPPPEPASRPHPEPPGERVCRHCGTPVPSESNTRCLKCHGPLAPPALILRFAHGGELELESGGQALLGRALDTPGEEMLRGFGTVGRQHATIGVSADGRAWLRDERSANGTFVNDCELTPKLPADLHDGDTIRLGKAVRATVTVTGGPRPDG